MAVTSGVLHAIFFVAITGMQTQASRITAEGYENEVKTLQPVANSMMQRAEDVHETQSEASASMGGKKSLETSLASKPRPSPRPTPRPVPPRRRRYVSPPPRRRRVSTQACNIAVSRRRRDKEMCSCRRRSDSTDLPSGYTCTGDKIAIGRDKIEVDRDVVQLEPTAKHGSKCNYCYKISAALWEERAECFLSCGETVYFPQQLGLYSQITAKYDKIGIYQLRLDVETDPVKTMWPLEFEYKYVAKTNRHKMFIKFYDDEPDEYSLHAPIRDCDGDEGHTACRNSYSEHSVSFKIKGPKKPLLDGFEVTWPL